MVFCIMVCVWSPHSPHLPPDTLCFPRVSYQRLSTIAAVRICSETTSTASSTSCWCSCQTRASSRSSWPPTETARQWRRSRALQEERRTRTRKTPGRCQPQRPTWRRTWTARCAPLVDRYWPPKTSTPTRPCTSETVRSSLPCSQSAVSSASLSALLFFPVCRCGTDFQSPTQHRNWSLLCFPVCRNYGKSFVWIFFFFF